jgi:hypothetical protein
MRFDPSFLILCVVLVLIIAPAATHSDEFDKDFSKFTAQRLSGKEGTDQIPQGTTPSKANRTAKGDDG